MTSEIAHHTDKGAPGKVAVQPEGLDTELIELLVDGARYDDLEDVQHALSSHADVNASDAAGRTGVATSTTSTATALLSCMSPLTMRWGGGALWAQ